MKRKWLLCLLSIVMAAGLSLGVACGKDPEPTPAGISKEIALEKIGVVHQAGQYYFDTDKDFLNEGADVIRSELGAKNIKVMMNPSLSASPLDFYAFNTAWPRCTTIVDIAKTEQFQTMLAKDFDTVVITAHDKNDYVWKTQTFTDELYNDTKKELYDLSKYLLETYKNTDRTFVIQNWEGDNMFANPNTEDVNERTAEQYEGMTRWFNARNDGVVQARNEVTDSKAKIYYAIEVNRISKTLGGKGKWLIDKIVPNTHADLYSYSCWEVTSKKGIMDNIAALKAAAPDSGDFGNDNVYVGEMGMQEQSFTAESQTKVIKDLVEGSVESNVPWVYYWQIYCNERVDDQKWNKDMTKYVRPENDGMNGYWLIRADGTYTNTWFYLEGLLKGENIPVDPAKRKAVPEYYYEVSKSRGIVNELIVKCDDLTDSNNLAPLNEHISANPVGLNFGRLTDEAYNGYFSKYSEDRSIMLGNGSVVYERLADVVAVEGYSDIALSSRVSFEVSKDDGATFTRIESESLQFPKKDAFWSQGIVMAELAGDVTHVRINVSADAGWEVQMTRVVFQTKEFLLNSSETLTDDMLDNSKLAPCDANLTSNSSELGYVRLTDEAFAKFSRFGKDRTVVSGEWMVYRRAGDFFVVQAYCNRPISELISFQISTDGGKTFRQADFSASADGARFSNWGLGEIKIRLESDVTHVKVLNASDAAKEALVTKSNFQKLDSPLMPNRIQFDDDLESFGNLAAVGGEIMEPHAGMTLAVLGDSFGEFSADKTVAQGAGCLVYERKGDVMVVEAFAPKSLAECVTLQTSIDGGYHFTDLKAAVTESPRHGVWSHGYLQASIEESVTHVRIQTADCGNETVKIARVSYMGYYERPVETDIPYEEPEQTELTEREKAYWTLSDGLENTERFFSSDNIDHSNEVIAEIGDSGYLKRAASGAANVVYEIGSAQELLIFTASIRPVDLTPLEIFLSVDGENWVNGNPVRTKLGGSGADWFWTTYQYSYTFGKGMKFVKISYSGGPELYDNLLLRVLFQSGEPGYQPPAQTELTEKTGDSVVLSDDLTDLTKVFSKSGNLKVETGDSVSFTPADKSYALRTDAEAANLVYEVGAAKELIVNYSVIFMGKVKLYVTTDGVNWIEAAGVVTGNALAAWSWTEQKLSYTFGAGVVKIKITLEGGDNYDPVLQKVVLQK